MDSPNSLRFSLHLPPVREARCAIINSLWQCNTSFEKYIQDNQGWESFFEYYSQQCTAALHDGGSRMMIRTHQDLVETINHVKDGRETRSSIKTRLRSKINSPEPEESEELLCKALDLSARILLMTSIGTFRNIVTPAQRTLQWQDDESLNNLLGREFSQQRNVTDHVKLERLFNARTIERTAGIKIAWTSNLADHLRLFDDDTRVMIFHHASFLKKMESRYVHCQHSCLLPKTRCLHFIPQNTKCLQRSEKYAYITVARSSLRV